MKLTAKQRKSIYAAVPAIIAILVAFGIVTTEQLQNIATAIGLAAGVVTSLLAFKNTDPNQDVDNTDDAVGGTDD